MTSEWRSFEVKIDDSIPSHTLESLWSALGQLTDNQLKFTEFGARLTLPNNTPDITLDSLETAINQIGGQFTEELPEKPKIDEAIEYKKPPLHQVAEQRALHNIVELPVDLDSLFDPIWQEESRPAHYPVMSEWDKAYQKRIETDIPIDDLPTHEDSLALVGTIQRGKSAELILESMDKVAHDSQRKNELRESVRLGEEAFDTLVTSHLRLATWFVRHTMDFHKRHRLARGEGGQRGNIVRDWSTLSGGELDYSDRVQIANMSLIKAAKTYTGYTRNGRKSSFSNWAIWRMEADLVRELGTVQSPIAVPVHKNNEIRYLNRAREEYIESSNHSPSYGDLAKKIGKSEQDVIELSQTEARTQRISWEVLRTFLSKQLIDKAVTLSDDHDDKTDSIEDLLVSGGSNITVEDEGIGYLLDKDVDDQIAHLKDRQQTILELYYGLNATESMTLEGVGQIIGVTRERVRQILAQAEYKMRYNDKGNGGKLSADRFIDEDPQFGLRTIVALDEADDAALGIHRPPATRSSKSNPVTRYAGAKKSYTLKEFEKMKQKADDQ